MTKILILGGGFSSIGVTQKLQKLAKKKHNIKLDIVCDNNYFTFQPMLPGVAAGTIEATHITNPIRRLCKKATFHRGMVEEIDTENKRVKVVEKDITRQHWLSYDHLIIGIGLSTDMSKVPGMNQHSLPMRTLGDAIFLRNEIINKLEMASVEEDPYVKSRLLTFVFVGGGFSGVETMGEVGDMIKSAQKNYPSISKDEIRLILIHSGKRILKELGEKLALFAQKKLRNRGMELRLNTRVQAVTPDKVILSNDDIIPTNTVVCTTGNAPHKVIRDLPFVNKQGRLDTDSHMRVVVRDENHKIIKVVENIWAIGDCASTPNLIKIKTEPTAICPPTAQFAVRMAPVLAKNIMRTIQDKKLKKFKFRESGQMAVIGHFCGVAEILGIRFSGILAFVLWRAVYLSKIPGIYCKFRVISDWLSHIIFPIDITQLDIYRTEKVDRSHYHEGDYVFRQNDIADYFYVIEEGTVEIVKEGANGNEVALAVLHSGDSFGEMGLMQKAPRSASVRCVTDVELLKVNRNDFTALTGSYSSMRDNLDARIKQINSNNDSSNTYINEQLDPLAIANKPLESPENDSEKSTAFSELVKTDADDKAEKLKHEFEQEISETPGKLPSVTPSPIQKSPIKQMLPREDSITQDKTIHDSITVDDSSKSLPQQTPKARPPYIEQHKKKPLPSDYYDNEPTYELSEVKKYKSTPPKFTSSFEKRLQGKSFESILSLEKNIEQKLYRQPSNPQYLKQYAEIQYFLGYLENSLTLYNQYLDLKNDDISVMVRVGDIHSRLYQYQKCINILNRAYMLVPHNKTIIINLSNAFRALKQYEEAAKVLEFGMKSHPNDSNILTQLAQCFNKINQAERGEELIRRQLFLTPKSIPALIILCESLLIQSRFIDAEVFVSEAERLDTSEKYLTVINHFKNLIYTNYSKRVLHPNK